ncbi:MAG: hypothetical protein HWQ41_03470 [Nostoc sp. NOS(2021)]|uniref:hypothetical protein n=1 Tax=Nostoc sp. NOS(2021) TaxID=2815407 RepID=UPI0025F13FBF|nr:hypothetical protein [Nostoc sp. NOS(2021)]MBN3894350.1 hypothetical protein [Nostoc sp. NOS(2021)]
MRNYNWDDICQYVEEWHWVANIWDNFERMIELNLWKEVESKLYSIAKPLIAEGKFIRTTSSRAHYGHVVFHIEPKIEDQTIQIIWQISDEKIIPVDYIPIIFEGIIDAIIEYFHKTNITLTSMKIIVYDGSHHEVDSRQLSYRIAAAIACRKALANAEFIRIPS